jgi:hypothetical protein
VLIVARPASATATYSALSEALEHVLRSGQLLREPQEREDPVDER